MNERERPQDPAEGPDDPDYVTESGGDDGDEDLVENVGDAMPGAGMLNEDPDHPGESDPDLRPDGPAPLP